MKRLLLLTAILSLFQLSCRQGDDDEVCEQIIDLGTLEVMEESSDCIPDVYLIGADIRFENEVGDQLIYRQTGDFDIQ